MFVAASLTLLSVSQDKNKNKTRPRQNSLWFRRNWIMVRDARLGIRFALLRTGSVEECEIKVAKGAHLACLEFSLVNFNCSRFL